MRYFFRSHVPSAPRILIVESGSRQTIEQTIPSLRAMLGEAVTIDVVTCYAGEPTGLRQDGINADARVFNVNDYDGQQGREQLLGTLLERRYPIVAVLCSAEPIMTKWKWWLGAKLPAKILIINENADFFFLDWARFDIVRKFVAYRVGLTGGAAIPGLARLVFFPAILGFLVLCAAMAHTRRKFH